VTSGHLWLYKTPDIVGHHFADTVVRDRHQTITVTQIQTPGTGQSRRRILASVSVRPRTGCWVRVNIHQAVLHHVQRLRDRSGSVPDLRLAVKCRGGCMLDRGRPTAVGGNDRRPLLVVGTVESGRRRLRRTPDSCPPSRCCLYELYIDFARIGWDFVLSPGGYWVNYCHGPCTCTYGSCHFINELQ